MSGDAYPKGAGQPSGTGGVESAKEEDWEGAGWGTPTRRVAFDDGSDITLYDGGRVLIGHKPTPITEEPHPVPEAELFFWNAICHRTDMTTREQICKAKKQMRAKRGQDA